DHLLEPERVEQVEQEIAAEDPRERRAEPGGEEGRSRDQNDERHENGRHREGSGSERAVLLGRMPPVLLAVPDVVAEVDRARGEAEGGEREQAVADRHRIAQLAREDERRQDEQVLRPLDRAQRADEGQDHGRIRKSGSGRRRYCTVGPPSRSEVARATKNSEGPGNAPGPSGLADGPKLTTRCRGTA